MTKTGQAFRKRKSATDWRSLLGDLCLLAGTLVLVTTLLFWVRSAMAAQQNGYQPYLVSSVDMPLPLPSGLPSPIGGQRQAGQEALATPAAAVQLLASPEASQEAIDTPASAVQLLVTQVDPHTGDAVTAPAGQNSPTATPTTNTQTTEVPQSTPVTPTETGLPLSSEQPVLTDQTQPGLTDQTQPGQTEPAGPVESEIPHQPTTNPMYPAPEGSAAPPAIETPAAPVQAPAAGPVVRLVIPRLQVNRAVVPVELSGGGNGNRDWNTDALFSTPNRSDLVGQLAVSANPGEGGNILLVGHNYNNGWYDWEGVFARLGSLQTGDAITLYTESGAEFHYIVEKVKKVPWQKRNLAELEKHQKYLWPTGREQLTLVTCGGTVLWTWQARIYVVAIPAIPLSP